MNEKQIIDWLRQQAERIREASPVAVLYLLAAVCAAVYFMPIFEIGIYWKLTVTISLVAIGCLRLWLVPLVLILVMGNLVLTEAPINFGPYHSVGDLLLAAAVLLFVVAASRYVVLAGAVASYYRGAWLSRVLTPLKHLIRQWRDSSPRGVVGRAPATFRPLEVVTGLVRIVLAVVAAALILSYFPLDPYSGASYGILPTATRAIEVGVALVAALVILYTVIESIAWHFLSPAAARMFLRGELNRELRADLVRIARYRFKKRKA